MDRARAALAVVAALLGAGEAEMFAHAIEQGGAWIDIQFMQRAIDVQLHVNIATVRWYSAAWRTVLACFIGICKRGIRKRKRMKLPGAHGDTRRTDACQEGAARHTLEECRRLVVSRVGLLRLVVHESNSR
jgi:hypothetical protein